MPREFDWLNKWRRGAVLKPCPFCGNTNLYAGPNDAHSYGIQCVIFEKDAGWCGAKIKVDLPGYWPKGVEGMQALYVWCLNKAVRKWNRRSKPCGESPRKSTGRSRGSTAPKSSSGRSTGAGSATSGCGSLSRKKPRMAARTAGTGSSG